MKNNFYQFSNLILFTLFLISCGNEQNFSSPTVAKSDSACDYKYNHEDSIQKTFSIVGPKVDFIFILDNSTSMTNYTNNLLMKKINESINKISDLFNVHMLFAPLLKVGNSSIDDGYFIADNEEGLNNSIKNKLTLKQNINVSISQFPIVKGSKERGFERAIELLNNNKSNGFLRKDAHTIIILASNGDDTNSNAVNNVATSMANIKSEMDNNRQFRFISIVPHQDSCSNIPTAKKATRYIQLSKQIFNYYKDYPPKHGLTSTETYPDSFNSCQDSEITRSIENINETINPDDHLYNFWPIAPSDFTLDPSKIDVKKVDTRNNKIIPLQENGGNGFKYLGIIDTKNIMLSPTEEILTKKHFIELFGTAIVLYPDYLIVKTQTYKNFFGYVRLQFKPYLKNLYLEIDGKTIPRSKNDPDGWEAICNGKIVNDQCDSGPHQQETQIETPEDWPNYNLKGDKSNGYFLKLGKNVVYSNNSVIKVKYFPNSKSAEVTPGCIGR